MSTFANCYRNILPASATNTPDLKAKLRHRQPATSPTSATGLASSSAAINGGPTASPRRQRQFFLLLGAELGFKALHRAMVEQARAGGIQVGDQTDDDRDGNGNQDERQPEAAL